jgi:uncharacterized protein DUF4058
MNSPFPGMDPFLELHWGDVHARLITYLCDAVQLTLPGDLRARIEERVYVESDLGQSRLVIPDVRVLETSRPHVDAGDFGGGGTAVAELLKVDEAENEPYIFELHGLEITEGFIEIRERGGGRVVTVIEVLSRANKYPGSGQQEYRRKQEEVLQSDASLVEIDLVRGGHRVMSIPKSLIPERHRLDYLACISPGWNRSQRLLYAMPLQKRLPAIRIPLREHDAPARIDVQPLIDRAYQLGGYDDINYSEELDPPLTVEEAAWAKSLVTAK